MLFRDPAARSQRSSALGNFSSWSGIKKCATHLQDKGRGTMLNSTRLRTAIFATVATLLLICVSLGRAQQTHGRKPQQSSSAQRTTPKRIPVDIPHLIFASVRVNNSQPLSFILDTASTWTMLDADQASALGL